MMKVPNKKLVVAGALVAIALSYCAIRTFSSAEWIDIGTGGPTNWTQYRYRLIELSGKEEHPSTHPDLTALSLALQSGREYRPWVYLPVFHCYAPSIRSGLPTVLCESVNGADVVIASTDNVREVLLGLRKNGQRGAVQGRAIGLHADDPVIAVNDPALRVKD